MKKSGDWENLLGELSPLPKPENLQEVIKEMLLEPLFGDEISRSVCSNCGHHSGINDFCCEKMIEIMKIMEKEIPPQTTDFNRYYFITSYCEVCRYWRDNPLDIEIKKI